MALRTVFVWVVVWCTVLTVCVGHSVDSRVITWSVKAGDKKTVSTKFQVPDGSPVTCKLTYSTLSLDRAKQAANGQMTAKVAETPKKVNGNTGVEEAMGRLEGTCVSLSKEYWTYELCVNERIRQHRGGDQYILGTVANPGDDGVSQVYTQGQPCNPGKDESLRQTTVRFACDRNADPLAMHEASEPSVCHYNLLVGAKEFCGDDRYEDVTGRKPASGAAAAAPAKRVGVEDWVMEIHAITNDDQSAKNAEAYYICAAYPTDYADHGADKWVRPFFEHLDIQMVHESGGARGFSQDAHEEVTIRRDRLTNVPSDQYQVQSNGKVALKDNFQPSALTYIKIVT